MTERKRRTPDALDPAKDCPPVAGAGYRYAVVSQPRTGSTWLCAHLARLGGFGVPAEYLNTNTLWGNVERFLGKPDACGPKGAFQVARFFDALERHRTTPNGCFGVKIQPHQLLALVGNLDAASACLSRFDALIMLSRRDRVAQAVSAAIAESTGTWLNDGAEPDLSGVEMRRVLQLTGVVLGRQFGADAQMTRMCRGAGRPVLRVVYEDMLADLPRQLDRVTTFLGQPGAPGRAPVDGVLPMPERPPGKVAAAVRARFIDFIEGRGD